MDRSGKGYVDQGNIPVYDQEKDCSCRDITITPTMVLEVYLSVAERVNLLPADCYLYIIFYPY